MLEMERRGLRTEAHAFLKRDKGTITHLVNGARAITAVPSRLGIRKRRDDGSVDQTWQLPLWWEMPWRRLTEGIANLRRQRDRLSFEIGALSGVLRLREQYPETRNALEACEIEGVDPRNIDVAALEERLA